MSNVHHMENNGQFTYQWADPNHQFLIQIPVGGGENVVFSATEPSSWLARYKASGLEPAEEAAPGDFS